MDPFSDVQVTENPIQSADDNPAEKAEGLPQGVSVIVFEDPVHQGKLVADARVWFQHAGIPVEFTIVSEAGPKLTPLSGCQQATSAQSLDSAIRSASHEHIAVIDAIYSFDPNHWNIVNPIGKEKAIRSWSYSPFTAPGSRKLLVWIYCLIVRFLLKVKKNRIAPGMTTFTKSQFTNIRAMKRVRKTPDSLVQLVASAKSNGDAVEEYCCTSPLPDLQWTKSNTAEPSLPKSKSIKRSIKRSLQFWFSEITFPARRSATEKSDSLRQHIFPAAVIMLLAAMLLLTNSGYPLFEPDEARNAQLAMNIVESGDWMGLTLNEEPYWDKPPLLAWMTAVSYKCFGVSEWSTRLPSILTSLSMLALMIVAGSKLLGARAALFGSAALLLAWGFAFQTRYVTMDALLMFFTTATTLGVAVGVSKSTTKSMRRVWLVASGISIGLGMLAKGPVCVVLTAPPIILWLFLNHDISRESIAATIKLVSFPAILVAAPWFVLTTIYNPGFAWYFLWKHHVVRFSDAFTHQEPFWYYVPILWMFMFPASILLPRVIHNIASRKPKYRLVRTPIHGLLAFSAAWIVGFFSMSQCKLPGYILPALPIIALLTGVVVNFELKRSTESRIRTRFDRLPKRISVGVSVLVVAVAIVAIFEFGNADLFSLLLFAFAILACTALLYSFILKKPASRNTSWLAASIIALIFIFLSINQLIPSIASERSILQSIAQGHSGPKSEPVVYFGRDSFASEYYLPDSKVVQIDEESLEELGRFLLQNSKAVVVATETNMLRVKEIFGDGISIVDAPGRHTFHVSVSAARIASDTREEASRK